MLTDIPSFAAVAGCCCLERTNFAYFHYHCLSCHLCVLTTVVCRYNAFQTRVHYQHARDVEQEASLLFIHYYIAAPDQQLSKEQREQDPASRRLVWEQSPPRGRSRTLVPMRSLM